MSEESKANDDPTQRDWPFEELCDGKGFVTKNDLLGKFTLTANKVLFPLSEKYREMRLAFYQINSSTSEYIQSLNNMNKVLTDIESDFKTFNNDGKFLRRFMHHIKVARGTGYVLTLIYFIFLLCFVLLAIGLLIAYCCVNEQQKIVFFLNITWNVIRFFMFSFFVYGAAYGMLYLGIKDGIAYCMYAFSGENLNPNVQTYIIPGGASKEFMRYCILEDNANYINKIDSLVSGVLSNFWTSFTWLKTALSDGSLKFSDTWRTELNSRLINSYSAKKLVLDKQVIYDKISKFQDSEEVNKEGDLWVIYDGDESKVAKQEKLDLDDLKNQLDQCYEEKEGKIVLNLNGKGLSNCFDKTGQQSFNNYYIDLRSVSDFDELDKYQKFLFLIDDYLGIDNWATVRAYILYYLRMNLTYKLLKTQTEELASHPIYIVNDYNNTIYNENGRYESVGKYFNTEDYKSLLDKSEGFFDSFGCSYLKNDVNIIYTTMYDLSTETRKLCALSCCIGFFGAIAVYLILWNMHHFNRDFNDGARKIKKLNLSSDSSVSPSKTHNVNRIKKSPRIDPAYKKRKIRSEIEMTSRNEDESKESYKKSLSQNEVK